MSSRSPDTNRTSWSPFIVPGAPVNLEISHQITIFSFPDHHPRRESTTMKISPALRSAPRPAANGHFLVLQGVARTFLPTDVHAALKEIGATRSGAPTLGTSASRFLCFSFTNPVTSDKTTNTIHPPPHRPRLLPSPLQLHIPPDIPLGRIPPPRKYRNRPFPDAVPRFPRRPSARRRHRQGSGQEVGAGESVCEEGGTGCDALVDD